MRNYNKLYLFFGLIVSMPVFANDSAGTTAAGGIQFIKTSMVKMLSEDLTISPTMVKVNYLFQNLSDKVVTTEIFFPLPPYRMLGANEPWDDEIANDKNAPFKNFSVIVNGRPVAYQVKTQAMLEGKDIAQSLIKAGIPLNTQLAAGQVPMGDQQYAQFKQWHAKAQQLGLLDAKGNPRWQKQVIYYWTQNFPAKQKVTITHQYKPAAGEFYAAKMPNNTAQGQDIADIIQRIKALFNLNLMDLKNGKNFKNWLLQQQAKPAANNGIYAFFYNVNYVLTTGANWAGPIQHFTLTLNYPQEGMVAYNHFYKDNSANLIMTAGKTQLMLTDFVPQKDLNIVFGTNSVPLLLSNQPI